MKWRALFEASAMARDAADSGGLLFGNPASDSDIHALEQRLGLVFSAEFKEIYGELNGVGLRYTEDEEIWWLVPLDQIEAQTFPDWDEIATSVKLTLFSFWLLSTAGGIILLFKTRIGWERRTKTIVLGFLSFVLGTMLFVSMFLFDWASILR